MAADIYRRWGGIQVAGEEVKTIWQSRNGCPVGPTFFEDEKGRPYRTFKSIDVNGRFHRSLKTQEPPNGGSAPLHRRSKGMFNYIPHENQFVNTNLHLGQFPSY